MGKAVILFIALASVSVQLSFSDSQQTGPENEETDSRLGLLASSLGVEPVPGASNLNEKANLENYDGEGDDGGQYGENREYNPISLVPGKCQCIKKEYCPGRPGSGHHYHGAEGGPGGHLGGVGHYGGDKVDPGLVAGERPDGPHHPGSDGVGNIDIRIVNRPAVQCSHGEIYCCGDSKGSQVGGPISGVPHGCGFAKIIPVPTYQEVYGQANFGEYPWIAVILTTSNNYLGAGALIDKYHIVTAAHKVAEYKVGGQLKVRLGEWNAQEDTEPFKNIEIEVNRVDLHPAFNPQNLQNDVAIIKLAQPIDLEAYPHIKSACLPNQGSDFTGQRCWVAGFGKDAFTEGKHSFYLKEVDLPIVNSYECEGRLRQTRLGSHFVLNRKSFLCAGGEEGKDACTGDGGAPLVCSGHDGRFQVVGLVAWGIGCAENGIPGVYVNIPNYVSWIHSKLAY